MTRYERKVSKLLKQNKDLSGVYYFDYEVNGIDINEIFEIRKGYCNGTYLRISINKNIDNMFFDCAIIELLLDGNIIKLGDKV
jgi:hypothetical protein